MGGSWGCSGVINAWAVPPVVVISGVSGVVAWSVIMLGVGYCVGMGSLGE